ncbi:MAG: LexA family transcriptional regulator [Candidatus Pacebacteria bacterium]|nr:LexA family transcriptional regulator [Candidatus Paceibacterota bacterium]
MADERHIERVTKFFRTHKRMPSVAELTRLAGFTSKNAGHRLAQRLIDQKILAKDATGKLVPHHASSRVKLLGVVEAGWPSPAEEELVDTMNLDEYLIENKEATYLLRVKGDSMIDAGIQEGDLVIAERTNSPKVGTIVIAEVDGEWTMKYLRKNASGLFLEAANAAYKPIHPEEGLRVIATVKGVIRKY